MGKKRKHEDPNTAFKNSWEELKQRAQEAWIEAQLTGQSVFSAHQGTKCSLELQPKSLAQVLAEAHEEYERLPEPVKVICERNRQLRIQVDALENGER